MQITALRMDFSYQPYLPVQIAEISRISGSLLLYLQASHGRDSNPIPLSPVEYPGAVHVGSWYLQILRMDLHPQFCLHQKVNQQSYQHYHQGAHFALQMGFM